MTKNKSEIFTVQVSKANPSLSASEHGQSEYPDVKLLTIPFLDNLLQRGVVLVLSLTLPSIFYLLSSLYNDPSLFSGSGSFLIVIGLLLTLKHNFISDVKDYESAYKKFNKEASVLSWECDINSPEASTPVLNAVKDEYLGITITVLGTFISGFGQLLPLINT